eukprot:2682880-Rhodomonas_salina.2
MPVIIGCSPPAPPGAPGPGRGRRNLSYPGESPSPSRRVPARAESEHPSHPGVTVIMMMNLNMIMMMIPSVMFNGWHSSHASHRIIPDDSAGASDSAGSLRRCTPHCHSDVFPSPSTPGRDSFRAVSLSVPGARPLGALSLQVGTRIMILR